MVYSFKARVVCWCFFVLPIPFADANPLPDTGQTECYDDRRREIACPQAGERFHGQDGNYTINPPSFTRLDAQGNDLPREATEWTMVRDNVTGLIWEVKTDDGTSHDKDNRYTWCDNNPETNGGNIGTCGDGTDSQTFVDALNVEEYGSFSDWRLPSLLELHTIGHYGRTSPPAIDTDYFPSTILGVGYWTSDTTVRFSDTYALYIDHHHGYINADEKSAYNAVRAVRTPGLADVPQHHQNTANSDGTITDPMTGLMWAEDRVGPMNWEEAIAHCENLVLAEYDDWRLPNIRELLSIVSDDSEYFFSSTTFSTWADLNVWVARGHDYVHARMGARDSDYYFLPVRGGQNVDQGKVEIRQPKQGANWEVGGTQQILWKPNGTSGDVQISLSRQGGKGGTFVTIIGATENDGEYVWSVSDPVSVNCVLRIEPIDEPSTGCSQGLFDIYRIDIRQPVITGLEDDPAPTFSKKWEWGSTDENPVTYRYTSDQNETWSFPEGSYSGTSTATKEILVSDAESAKWYIHVQARDSAGNESEIVTASAILLSANIDNGDETITNMSSGLIWQKYGNEQAVSKTAASSNIALLNSTLNSDWRLPTPDELKNMAGYIIDLESYDGNESYWSNQSNDSGDYCVVFIDHGNSVIEKSTAWCTSSRVLAVREPGDSPIAKAGSNQICFGEITLDATESRDPDGEIAKYEWVITKRGDPSYVEGLEGISPTVSDIKPGFYDATLTVTDASGEQDTDTMMFSATGSAYTQEQLDQRLSEATLGMLTQDQLDQAVTDAEAAKDVTIATRDQTITDLNTTISSMFTETQLDQAIDDAVSEAISGLFTQAELDQSILDERQKWDRNNDGKIGLEEAIHCLQVLSGVRTE